MTCTYRLPRHITPIAYEIDIDASVRRSTFSGSLRLHATARAPFDSLELNAHDLRIKNAKVTVAKVHAKANVQLHPERQSATFALDKTLPKGPLVLTLDFQGKLNPRMHGLYLARDGAQKAIVSQCEATDARAIFPCFDEPDLKATLKWTVRTDAKAEVITNGVLNSRRKNPKNPAQVIHSFEPTRVISTYLAALTIGDFESSKRFDVCGVPCRILFGPGKTSQAKFAQEVTEQVLPWYEKYFGHPYNYQKLDQVAVPGFDAGAMENVGAIFYRQNLLLMDPATTSFAGKKRIAEVIAHEIAHQWFGNLVTMQWWDDLWLNEAFATWIAYKACDLWQPQWRMWDDFLESKQGALAADALHNTHPIYTPVESPAEATELFDIITYEKGCAVLRMVESFLGDKVFRDGIVRYQKAFKNGNAKGSDLWDRLEAASKQPLGSLMQSWTMQPGFPLVRVEVKRRGSTSTELELFQRRFFASSARMQETNDQLWEIPMVVVYGTGQGPNMQVHVHRALLSQARGRIELPHGDVRFVYPNQDATGFYRLELSATELSNLLQHGLSHLSPGARINVLSDQWASVQGGIAPITSFLDCLQAFVGERDHMVMRAVVGRLRYIQDYLVDDAQQANFAGFTRYALGAQAQELGFEATPGEPIGDAVRRAAVLGALCEITRDASLLQNAWQCVEREMHDETAVEANLAGVLCAVAAFEGDASRLLRYIELYRDRKRRGASPEAQSRYLYALHAFEKSSVQPLVLKACADGTIPQEQLRSVFVQLLGRRATKINAWKFLKKHWSEFGPKFGSMGISHLVEATGSLPAAFHDDVASFFKKNPVPEAERALNKALESMQLRAELINRTGPELSQWLARAPKA